MLKHIVFWKLLDEAEGGTKRENALIIKERLEALQGRIEGMISMEVGVGIEEGDFDACLVSKFTDKAALDHYKNHPLHKEVQSFVHKVKCGRACVDFESEE